MAYFAQLDENSIVVNVVSVENYILQDENGIEQEQKGVEFLIDVLGDGLFVQTSYNDRIRGRYAGIGFRYDVENDVFICEQPYPSWVLNSNFDWESPVPRPSGENKIWNEEACLWEDIAEPFFIAEG